MGYSGDDCDTCKELRSEIADLQSTIEHKKKECLKLLARGDSFFAGQQRVVAQRDELLTALNKIASMKCDTKPYMGECPGCRTCIAKDAIDKTKYP